MEMEMAMEMSSYVINIYHVTGYIAAKARLDLAPRFQ